MTIDDCLCSKTNVYVYNSVQLLNVAIWLFDIKLPLAVFSEEYKLLAISSATFVLKNFL